MMKVNDIPQDIGDVPIGEVVLRELDRVYTEDAADNINQALVALLPSRTVRVWVLPIPTGVIKAALLRLLDSQTPDLVLRVARLLLHKVGLAYGEGSVELDDLRRRAEWPGNS